MNLGSVLQHESHRPIRLNDLCRRPAAGRETGLHRLDVLRRPPVSPGGVEVNGEVDHTVEMRRSPAESLAVKRAQNRLRRLCLRPQFHERRFIGRKADAVRLSDYPSLRFFQFTQPVFQVHLSPPIVPAAARNQQPRRLVAPTSRDSQVCCRAWGPSSRPEYQPSLRPAFALHPRPILGRRRYARRRRTPCGCEHRLCARVPRLARGRRVASRRRCRSGLERHTDGPLSSSLGTCHLPLGAVLAAWVIPPPYPTRLDHLSLASIERLSLAPADGTIHGQFNQGRCRFPGRLRASIQSASSLLRFYKTFCPG